MTDSYQASSQRTLGGGAEGNDITKRINSTRSESLLMFSTLLTKDNKPGQHDKNNQRKTADKIIKIQIRRQ